MSNDDHTDSPTKVAAMLLTFHVDRLPCPTEDELITAVYSLEVAAENVYRAPENWRAWHEKNRDMARANLHYLIRRTLTYVVEEPTNDAARAAAHENDLPLRRQGPDSD